MQRPPVRAGGTSDRCGVRPRARRCGAADDSAAGTNGGRIVDEAGPAAHRAEGVDDPVVLGEVAGVLPVHGHPADGIDEHDVVDDGRGVGRPGERGGIAPGQGRRTRRRHEGGPATADLDELGEDGEGDLLGRLGAEVEAGRGAERGDPLGFEHVSSRSHVTDHGRPRRRRDEPDVGDVARAAPRGPPPRPRRPGSPRRRTAARRTRASRAPCRPGPPRQPGTLRPSPTGSNTDTCQPVAAPSATSAPAIGVVPATQRCGAGRCGST